MVQEVYGFHICLLWTLKSIFLSRPKILDCHQITSLKKLCSVSSFKAKHPILSVSSLDTMKELNGTEKKKIYIQNKTFFIICLQTQALNHSRDSTISSFYYRSHCKETTQQWKIGHFSISQLWVCVHPAYFLPELLKH